MNIDMTLLALAVLTAAPTAQGSLPDAFPFGISEQRTPSALGCNSVTGGPPDSTGHREDSFMSAIIREDRQIFHQWNDLGRRFKNMQSTSLTISGSEDLGHAVYGVYRFAGNDRCVRQMELVTGLFSDE